MIARNEKIIELPGAVKKIYDAVSELEAKYPGRKFTPDGHLVGSIGEVIAAEHFGFELLPASTKEHDARDSDGQLVQIKLTSKSSVALYGCCERLIVMKMLSHKEAAVIYDGPGKPVWDAAGKMGKNGQRPIPLSRLRKIADTL